MTAQNQSRADALTDEHIKAVWDRECGSYTVWEEWDIPGFVRACIAASPVEQPAVAPMLQNAQLRRVMDLLDAHLGDSDPTLEGMTQEEIEEEFPVVAAMQIIVGLYQDPPTASDTAPSPANERAAFEQLKNWPKMAPREVFYAGWRAARAASANETGAEGLEAAARRDDVNAGWALYERLHALMPDWYPDAWEDLLPKYQRAYTDAAATRSPAMAAEAVALAHVAVAEDGGKLRWMTGRKPRDCELYAATTDRPLPGIVYVTPQPAQADARVGLTDALRRAREELSIVEWENDPPARVTDLLSTIDALIHGAKQ